ncbi:hypothetical protein ABZ135_16905 [Streptomyces sp. NPDC006339]|uniref:hypothetical protein n=1 Tax=Streptomyces sp. NPDC006339 TaxID=3156755 RepID=UPI0033B0A109
MKNEAKALAVGWGCWLLLGFKAAPHRHNTDIADTAFLVFFGLSTLLALAMTVRFLYRLVTTLRRASEPRAATSDHEETAAESP